MMTFAWQPKHVEELDRLRTTGLSASMIAEKLRDTFEEAANLTRSSIIGKIDRLRRERDGYAPNPRIRERVYTSRPHVGRSKAEAAPVEEPAKPAADPKQLRAEQSRLSIICEGIWEDTLLTRKESTQCCFPHPDDIPSANMRVCGKRLERAEHSYCLGHRKVLSRTSLREEATRQVEKTEKRKPSATLHRAGGKI